MKNTIYTDREIREYRRAMRRKQAMRKKILTYAVSILIILICSISFFNTSSAHGSDEQVKFKYYTQIEINVNDTLWSIAKEYVDYDKYDSTQDYVDEVMAINHMEDETIKSGSKIVVPYYSTEFR